MSKNIDFVIKAKVEYIDVFRRAFERMKAIFSEELFEGDDSVIVLHVSCNESAIGILNDDVPVHAYASVGTTAPPL